MTDRMGAQLAASWGSGAPVLLLHGNLVPDPVRHWAALQPLADRYQLRVAVRSGYATHPEPPLASMDDCVAEAIALLGEGAHLAVGERLAAHIGAQWQILKGRNHGVQSLGEPFNRALSSFWDSASPGGAGTS